MNPLAIATGASALAAAVLFGLWQWERASHADTLRDLDAETRRANVATGIANSNAEKLVELEKDMAVRDERARHRETENNRILAELNDELLKTHKRMGAWKNAIEKRPEVAERAMRAELNRRLRHITQATCRTDCGSEDNPANN